MNTNEMKQRQSQFNSWNEGTSIHTEEGEKYKKRYQSCRDETSNIIRNRNDQRRTENERQDTHTVTEIESKDVVLCVLFACTVMSPYKSRS